MAVERWRWLRGAVAEGVAVTTAEGAAAVMVEGAAANGRDGRGDCCRGERLPDGCGGRIAFECVIFKKCRSFYQRVRALEMPHRRLCTHRCDKTPGRSRRLMDFALQRRPCRIHSLAK